MHPITTNLLEWIKYSGGIGVADALRYSVPAGSQHSRDSDIRERRRKQPKSRTKQEQEPISRSWARFSEVVRFKKLKQLQRV